MGGHGAMWLAMRHSDIWGNVGSMSGGLDILPFANKWKMKETLGEFENNEDVWKQHTVINLVDSLKPGQLKITFDCGVDDFFIDVNRNMHKALVDAKIPHDYTERRVDIPVHTGKTQYFTIFFSLTKHLHPTANETDIAQPYQFQKHRFSES